MFSSIFIGRTKRPLLLALALAALVVPAAAATPAATPACRGNAPLPGGASTNPRSAAGLTARGWDYWSGYGATCRH